jgi:hypothetical protein
MADPSNWLVACSYLSHCGEQGMGAMSEFLLTLPFRFSNIEEAEEPVPVSQAITVTNPKAKKKKPAPVAELDEILAFCTDHKLELTVRDICRVCAWGGRLFESRASEISWPISTGCITSFDTNASLWQGHRILCEDVRFTRLEPRSRRPVK